MVFLYDFLDLLDGEGGIDFNRELLAIECFDSDLHCNLFWLIKLYVL
jgi:hypothetical protein